MAPSYAGTITIPERHVEVTNKDELHNNKLHSGATETLWSQNVGSLVIPSGKDFTVKTHMRV